MPPPEEHPDPPLEARRFLFVTGKGGVGKTTVAAALAQALAGRKRRVLVAMCDTKERLSTMLGVGPIGQSITRVADGIDAVVITPEDAMREYGEMIIRSRTVASAVFDNKYTRSFFAAVPGLYEWAMLGKAWYHSTETAPDGSQRYDVVIFDAPATGHGLDMVRVPKVIVEVVPPGVLRRDAEKAWQMFQDRKQTAVVMVTLAEDMPANETIELADALGVELGLPLGLLVINAVVRELFDESERAQLLEPRELDRSDAADEAIAAGVRRAIRESVQAEALAKLDEHIEIPRVDLPLLLRDAATPDAVAELAEILAPEVK